MHRAFTLIEILAVLFVLALVGGFAVSIDARSMTHSADRVWRDLETGLRRCSVLALEHGGGVFKHENGELAFSVGAGSGPPPFFTMPEGWNLSLAGVEAIRFDARGRCADVVIKIIGEDGAVVDRARLNGITLTIEPVGRT